MIVRSKEFLRRFRDKEDGQFGIMASVTSLMLVMCVGSSMEIMRIQSAQSKIQTLTDNLGLNAAIYIKNNGTPPELDTQGFVEGKNYKVEDLNFGKPISNVSGYFTIKYNEKSNRAEPEFNGRIETAFLSAFGKPRVNLTTKSFVTFPKASQTAVSVALIVDNSGSMGWDDKPLTSASQRQSGTIKRIDGLKQTAIKFSQDMEENIADSSETTSTNYMRMGLIPYNTDVISSRVSNPDWGVLDVRDINDMDAGGGTDSRGPLQLAANWMNDEDAIHELENEIENPKKYVVLMSDGSNNEEWVCDWDDRNRTRLWRRFNGFKYEYKNSRRSPGSGWTEGVAYNCKLENKSNSGSLEVCQTLKNNNVEIFTIGFALEPGTYLTSYPSTRYKTTTTKSTSDDAYGFLSACASSKDHFIKAENSDALEEAFVKIGKKIVEDTIRIAG